MKRPFLHFTILESHTKDAHANESKGEGPPVLARPPRLSQTPTGFSDFSQYGPPVSVDPRSEVASDLRTRENTRAASCISVAQGVQQTCSKKREKASNSVYLCPPEKCL